MRTSSSLHENRPQRSCGACTLSVGRQPKPHRVRFWSNTVHQWLRWKSTLTSPKSLHNMSSKTIERFGLAPSSNRRPATLFRCHFFVDSVRRCWEISSHPIPQKRWPLGKLSGLQEVVTVTAPFRCSDGRRLDRLAGAKQNPRPKEMPIRTASRDGHPGRPCLSPLSHELSLCETPHRLFVGMLGGFVDWTF
jgi:hypothetical protein